MKMLRTTVVAACAAAVLTWPLAASAVTSTASAAGPPPAAAAAASHKTSIRFLDFDRTRGYGSTIHIRGQLYVPALSGAVQDAHVRLYRQGAGHGHWAYVETRKTSIGTYPKFRFSVGATGNAVYRVVFRGNSTYARTHGDAGVDVYRTFHARLESGSGRFHGTLAPAYRHHTVYLDERRCGACSWHRAQSGRTSRHSRFSFTTTAPRHRKRYWRVSTPPSTRFIASHSAVFTTSLH
jgi:hypothetical protein